MISPTDNKFYLSKEGLARVKEEHRKLIEFKKGKIRGEVPALLHSEDVNPEYLAFQEDLSILESRLAEYEEILKNAELTTLPPKEKRGEVHLGAKVKIDLGGEVDEFTIVGTLETNPLEKKISNLSPLGSGLLGAKVGDVIKIKTALVNHDCRILKISYR